MSGDEAENLQQVGRLVEIRYAQLGMSQAEFAKTAGVDPKTLRGLVRGESWPQAKTRAAIESALGWPEGQIATLASAAFPPNFVDSLDETVDVSFQPRPRRADFESRGSLTVAATPVPLGRFSADAKPTLGQARQTVADHERDIALAVEELKDLLSHMVHAVNADPSRAAPEIDHALAIVDKIDMAVRGANWWRAQLDALRREGERSHDDRPAVPVPLDRTGRRNKRSLHGLGAKGDEDLPLDLPAAARTGRRDRPDEHAD